jgi:hypothetical protein
LQKASISFFMSVYLSTWNNLAPTGWIFMRFHIQGVFYNVLRKFKFYVSLTRIAGILDDDL